MSATAKAATVPAAPTAAHAKAPRPRAVWGLVAALALLVPFSAPAAWLLISDPSGATIGIPPAYRDLLPVADFLLVGVFLLAFYTVLPLVLIAGLVTKREWRATRWLGQRAGMHWAWVGAVGLGAVVVAWIAAEMVLFRSAPAPEMTLLWVICLVMAAAIFAFAASDRVRSHYRVEPAARTSALPSAA